MLMFAVRVAAAVVLGLFLLALVALWAAGALKQVPPEK
jgi:hypothetical protein